MSAAALDTSAASATVAAMSLIVIRAELTQEQWRALRMIALERDIPVQQLVGDALVEYLEAQTSAELEAAS